MLYLAIKDNLTLRLIKLTDAVHFEIILWHMIKKRVETGKGL